MVLRRMRGFTSITVLLLCSQSWMSESHTVEVRPGAEVTLMCSNISTNPTQTEWLRVVNRTKPSCISGMYGADGHASFCVGVQNGKFEMSSDITTVFLKIKQVDLSDTGLYFCGFYMNAHITIGNPTELSIQGNGESNDEGTTNEPDEMKCLISMILGGVTVLLTIVVVVLAVKIRKLQKAVKGESQTEKSENLRSDDVNYAALTFQARSKRNRRPATQRAVEPNVVYAATR